MSMRNISLKVAVGFAYPNDPEASYHHGVIPAGYARVGVDEVMTGFHTMELEIPGGEEEKTQGDVERGFALWNKKYIILPDSLPRPPTPPCSSPPQQQSPHLPERDPARVHLDLRRVRKSPLSISGGGAAVRLLGRNLERDRKSVV